MSAQAQVHYPASPSLPARATNPTLFEPGRNCCTVATADRATVLVDGCIYFAALDEALRGARRSILIVGWDFDGHLRLRADREGDDAVPLGPLLRRLVEENEDLEVRVLVWSVAVVHAPSAPGELLVGGAWQDHPRIRVRLDTTHPIYAAHHQKIVCIDGALAFVGGMDLTVDRWDTPEHRPEDPRRRLPNGDLYGPVHDLHMLVDGEAAQAVCGLAETRWRQGTGEPPSKKGDCAADLWPAGLPVEFRGLRLALSRTQPAWGERQAAHESARMTVDLIRAARRSILIEAQYFSAAPIGAEVAKRLAEPDGPEIVVIVSRSAHSLLERFVMCENRDRLIRRLVDADRFGRFHIHSPMVSDESGRTAILVHSKLILVDDRLMRIGSSNMNNRSLGLDTELDITLEAAEEDQATAITAFRDRLLAEHLGTTPRQVASAHAATGSIAGTIRALAGGPRTLDSIRDLAPRGPRRPMPGTAIFDPKRPFEPLWFLKRRRRRQR
nr:phospholipase D-like domain-containing protein [Prosthecomicrobium pneumaticum]